MSKTIFLLLLFLVSFSIAESKTTKDVFDAKVITFYGVDFTSAKFIGSDGFNNHDAIISKQIPSINELFFKESDKYNIKKYFHKEDVLINLDMIKSLNLKIKTDKLVIEQSYQIEKSTIEEMVAKYVTEQKSGIGLVFIVETLNKMSENGIFFVVFFDIETKSVLYTHKVTARAGGMGFRNYWAKVFFNGLKSCEEIYFNWEHEFSH